jgi:hypothetical protein
MSTGVLEVWRQPDGFWRWRYRDPSEGTDLVSNEGYPDRTGAVLAARTAYPGVREIRVERPRPSLGRWARRLVVIGLILWLPRRVWALFKAIFKVGVAAGIAPALVKRARGPKRRSLRRTP